MPAARLSSGRQSDAGTVAELLQQAIALGGHSDNIAVLYVAEAADALRQRCEFHRRR